MMVIMYQMTGHVTDVVKVLVVMVVGRMILFLSLMMPLLLFLLV